MKLSKEQIATLYAFTKQHFVEWYDLQTELVDHMANDIENILEENPTLSFEEAKTRAFKKFGVFGFMDIVDKRRNALEKRYRKMIFKEFIRYFTIPKIALTLLLIISVIELFRITNHNTYVIFGLFLSIIIFPLYFTFKTRKEIKQRTQQTGKKWLFEDSIQSLGGIATILYLPLQIFIQVINKGNFTFSREIFIAVFIVIIGLLYYVAIVVIPPKVKSIISKEYPNYKLA